MTTLRVFPFTGFDIETKPLPELVDKFTKPFPDFDPTAVKCGNLKDPVKIAEKMAQAEGDHQRDSAAYWKRAFDNAGLNPFTARVLVIGYINEDGRTAIADGEEKGILSTFWFNFARDGDAARRFVFWSGCGDIARKFDIDFILTRSRILGLNVPAIVREGRYYSRRIVDLAGEFLLHQREQYLSLTKCAELFGIYGEHGTGPDGATADLHVFPKRDTDEVKGENFWQWWEGTGSSEFSAEEQRMKATRYLTNDLKHLLHIAPRIL